MLENTKMNINATELIEDKQLSYRSIYSLNLVELETLKAYMKTYQKTEFIWRFKLPVNDFNLFNKKSYKIL